MESIPLAEMLSVLGVAVAASLLVLWVISRFPARASHSEHRKANSDIFLFSNDTLVDHEAPSIRLVTAELERLHNWEGFCAWFGARFTRLPTSLTDLVDGSYSYADDLDDSSGLALHIRRNGTLTHIELTAKSPVSPCECHHANLATLQAENSQALWDVAPFALWKTDASGAVIWSNANLENMKATLGRMPEPLPVADGKNTPPRFSISGEGQHPDQWFEVTSHPLEDATTLHIATAIDQVVRAETTQRDFLQTLTKTFANLTTGLAVFDKNQQLALFNPALVDLTGISVSFLSARPDVIRFFDELRERQVLPEPKNYASLRAQIREVIEQAHDGNYLEIWNLPGGVTYRVTGRPHPNGAIAFLIEDISAEVLKTRQFRTQIDLSQSVIDGLDEAIAVLAPNDTVVLCNTACIDLLRFDPGRSFAEVSTDDLINICQDKFHSDAHWAMFEANLREKSPSADQPARYLNARSGARMSYRIKPLPGGSRMINFRTVAKTIQPTVISAVG